MRALLSCVAVCWAFMPAAAAGKCSAGEVRAAVHWSMPCYGGIAAAGEAAPVPSPSKAEIGVPAWLKLMASHERLIAKAIQIGDRDEIQSQSHQTRERIADVLKWPDEGRWTYARVYCANRAQELANYVADRLNTTAPGEVSADASFRAYRAAGKECQRGLSRLR